jgi:thiamine pyrophosphokinase
MPAKEVDADVQRRAPGVSTPSVPLVVSGPMQGMPMRVVVVASADLDPSDGSWLDGADQVIAADGGAGSLDRIGRRPDRLIGDLDSIEPPLAGRLAAAGVRVDRHPPDKDASDTELAVEAALAAGATEVVLLGAFGGSRIDHELANLLLLADPALAGRDIRAVRGGSVVRALHGGSRVDLRGAVGDVVTLLPVGSDATGVTTDGLRWPLASATLRLGRSRGLSNEVVSGPASVLIEGGTLLVVETALRGDGT